MKTRMLMSGTLAVLWLILGGITVKAGVYYTTTTNVNLSHDRNAAATGGDNPGMLLSYVDSQSTYWGVVDGTTFRVDLGSIRNVGLVRIGNYGTDYLGHDYDATSYEIDYSTNDVDWVVATNVPPTAPMPYQADLAGAAARYVRLVGHTYADPNVSKIWAIHNADIYAAGPNAVKITDSLNIAGSRSNGGTALSGIQDHETAADWLNDEKDAYGSIGGGGDMPRTIILQLNDSYKVKGVRWNVYPDCDPLDYKIETSLGGGSWTQVYAYVGSAKGMFYYDQFSGDYGNTGILADKVRITVNTIGSRQDGLYLFEVEAFGLPYGVTNYVWQTSPSPTPPYTNWATAAHDIQSAIDAIPDGNTVVVTDGTYTVASQISLVRPVTVQSVHGSSNTFVGAAYPASTNRCFYLSNSGAVLDGFTITNGYLSVAYDYGAGVYIGTNGTIRNCTISSNIAVNGEGGGICCDSGGTVDNCTICNNCGAWGGGGVLCKGGGTISHCSVFANTFPPGGAWGGGVYLYQGGLVCSNSTIYSNSPPQALGGGVAMFQGGVVRDCVISNNTSMNGGGVLSFGDGPQVLNCTIVNNNAYRDLYAGLGYGGGVAGYSAGWSYTGPLVVSNCIIIGNYSQSGGGGIYSDIAGLVVDCPTIQNNSCWVYGGGAYFTANVAVRMENCGIISNIATVYDGGGVYGPGRLKNCVIRGNTACSYGQGYVGNGGGAYLPALLQNCTVAGNMAPNGSGGGVYLDSSGAMTNCIVSFNTAGLSNNVFNAGGTVAYTCSSPVEQGTGNIDADPRFVDLAGGDVHEKSRAGHWTTSGWVMDDVQSPCIDAGVPYDPANPASYFSSESRPNGERINMGAYGNTAQASKTLMPQGTMFIMR